MTRALSICYCRARRIRRRNQFLGLALNLGNKGLCNTRNLPNRRLAATRKEARAAMPTAAVHQTCDKAAGCSRKAGLATAAPNAPAVPWPGPPQPQNICTAPAAAPRTPPATTRMISSSSKTGCSKFSKSAAESACRRTVRVSRMSSFASTYWCTGWELGSRTSFRRLDTAASQTPSGTSPGTEFLTMASSFSFELPLTISPMSRCEVSTFSERKSENSTETSGCLFSKRP
mmetsp:Transcript_24288/g.54027  ORF Transcript_24288/g.54027 Transcript_24288/m.54027 type:complete len:231 (-) Transcript_24288:1099-1791(-)